MSGSLRARRVGRRFVARASIAVGSPLRRRSQRGWSAYSSRSRSTISHSSPGWAAGPSRRARRGLVDADRAGLGEVAEQHTDDGQRQIGVGGRLDDRPGASTDHAEQGSEGVVIATLPDDQFFGSGRVKEPLRCRSSRPPLLPSEQGWVLDPCPGTGRKPPARLGLLSVTPSSGR
ncbi:hypothetical protein GCM10010121_007910 [Streptomyces brasiliensis]|uniref:Uncharacterized protein n=1 Tax=Streptomyces brasiliensis TaxID=1954 RepID=A0A917NGS4_9ACTN|nr:hypothetical protein GCM10010121_007910 [Streptomyces brasiliensis]